MSRLDIVDEETHKSFIGNTLKNFRRELMKRPNEVVLTSEHFHSRCIAQENVNLFREKFAEGFNNVRVIVYVRPQLDQLVSLYSTTLRNGYSDSMSEHLERHMKSIYFPYFDLRGLIERWGRVFGLDCIEVRPYKALPSKESGGVVADFCDLLNLKYDDPSFTSRSETNVSINAEGQDLLRILNEQDGIDRARRLKVISWLESHCSGKGATPELPCAKGFQSQFLDGNAWVAERFFPAHPEYLEPRWPAV